MANKSDALILWFEDITREDIPIVGEKGANLGEMTKKTGVPIPAGFCTTAKAYRLFIQENKLQEKIAQVLSKLKDPNDTETLIQVSQEIRYLITSAQLPKQLEDEIRAAYRKLKRLTGQEKPFVAVRSSAIAEGLPDASFAGQQDTYLNVSGVDDIIFHIKKCYSSLFTDRAIFYSILKGFDNMKVALSAVVQLMVYSMASGVMFTLDASNGDRSVVLIKCSWGLGEYIAQGKVTPDEYYVRKSDLQIIKKSILPKKVMLVTNPSGGIMEMGVPSELQNAQILTDKQIIELAAYAIEIERHYGKPMNIEWALDERDRRLYILQARPETVWAFKEEQKPAEEVKVTEESRSSIEISEKYDVFDVVCSYCGKTSFGVLLKPNTTHRIVCPECKHTTYVRVLEDLSIQMYKEDEACQECHGTGYVTCPKCEGDGYLVYIEDENEVSKFSSIDEHPGKHTWYVIGCPKCGGRGSRLVVKDCGWGVFLGELDHELRYISKGSGKVKCSRCGGTGFMIGTEAPRAPHYIC